MTETLPEPKSRKESYLAKAAGMSVEVPEKPESREEQYLAAIAEGGGGGGGTTYTAGDGIVIADDTISVDTTTIQPKLTAGSNITISDDTISATDTTYSDFTGTDGTSVGASGLVPAPATTDAGKFLKADGTWDTAGGGGGDTVYSTVTTSNSNNGGAVYIGNLNANQEEQPDPTPSDIHEKYFWALPNINSAVPGGNSVNILGSNSSNYSVVIGRDANAPTSIGENAIAIGSGASVRGNYSVAIGLSAFINNNLTHSVALGDRAAPTRVGEVNVGHSLSFGYNNTRYRVIGGVHDPVDNHDAATKGYVDGKVLQNAGAPTTATEGVVGGLYEDTTNGKLYICTAVTTGVDPDPDTYTWEEVGAGGEGGVIELTSADYNYPSGNPTRIALWLLDTGEYLVKQGTSCFFASGWSVSTADYDIPVSITKDVSANITRVKYLNFSTGSPVWYEYNVVISSGDIQAGDASGKLTGGLVYSTYNALDADNNQDGLLAPLSAYQGRVLNNKITPTTGASAPSTSTTGELGKIYIDTTNDTAYMCVKVSSGTYTWKQITV